MTIECPKCKTDNPDTASFCNSCATELKPSDKAPIEHTETLQVPTQELTRGSVFADRYEVIEELGKGGMGKVYKVFDKSINEKIALKLIKPEIASDKNTIERFSNELKLARKVAHRNVCRMYDLNKEEGSYYITMEYVSGEDLKSFIRRSKQLVIGTAISIAKQICDGLEEAHNLGVVHRDLKPSNIMIDKNGNARIMDFGIARSTTGKGITDKGIMIGTPEYMSPEQVEGKEIDQRTDIYSLGIILYEMLTGRVPFEGDTALTVAVKHKTEEPKEPKEYNEQISDDLNGLIIKCLDKDKEKRYQSAGEVRSELENIEKGMPTTDRVIPKRKPLTSKEITVTLGLKKLLVPVLVFMAVVIIVLAIWQLLPNEEITPKAQSGKPSLAVVYFENLSGSENLDGWRIGLSELIITDLAQSKFINVLSGDRIYSLLKQLNLDEAKKYSTEDLIKISNEGTSEHVISGSFIEANGNFVINIMLQKPQTGEVIRSKRLECSGEHEIAAKVDELTRQIKQDLNLTRVQIASDFDKEVAGITSNSPEAYKHFIEGMKAYLRGDHREAVQSYEKAITIDPDFAMAYKYLGIAYYNQGYIAKAHEYEKKAFELIDHVSDKERFLIQAGYYMKSEETYAKAIETLNELLELYPEHVRGHHLPGWIYMQLEQWDKAIEQYEWFLQNKGDAIHYSNLAYSYRAIGLYNNAIEILEDYLINHSDNSLIRRSLASTFLCRGEYNRALVEANRAFGLDPTLYNNLSLKGWVYYCKGDLNQAEQEFQKVITGEDKNAQLKGLGDLGALYQMQGRFKMSGKYLRQGLELAEQMGEKDRESEFRLKLAYLYFISGNPNEALEESSRALSSAVEAESLAWKRHAIHFKGIIYLEMNTMDSLNKVPEELRDLIEGGLNTKAMKHFHRLKGMIELKKKNYSDAIEFLKKACSLLPHQHSHYWVLNSNALYIDSLALAYYKSGDLEKARGEYERITGLTIGKVSYGDLYVKSFYMLGKIYEQQKDTEKAQEYYEKFLELWKDADPGMTEVEDAKARLARLKGI
jgi:serine/threonine protein kinase/Flp pilus assembly protein TadD